MPGQVMHILHVNRDATSPGGVPHQTRQLIAAQAALGLRITVITLPGPVTIESPCVNVHALPADPIAGRRALRSLLVPDPPDVCHFTALSIPEHIGWLSAVRSADIPYVVSPHGLLSPIGLNVRWEGKIQSPLRRIVKSAFRHVFDVPMLRHASAIHAQSEFERECVLSVHPGAKVNVIPLGVDREWVNESTARRRSLVPPLTLGYLGRLDVFHKGLDLVLDAVQNSVRVRSMRIVFAGSPVKRYHAALTRRAADLGVEIRGEIWGAEKERFWSQCHFFWGAFRFAGMARAIGEALGHGVPVIASREGNWGDVIAKNKMGCLVGLNSASVLACLEKLLDMDERSYSSLSFRAVNFAKNWSWHQVAASMVEMYSLLHTRIRN